jgi:cell wall-associated NlpC family hydrolase
MTTLTYAQVAALVKKVGFPKSDWVNMTAICSAESGRRVEAKNPSSSASGLWQILWSVHQRYDQRRLLSDAEYNARAAYDIYKSQGKTAWVVWSTGAYKKYLNAAKQGVAKAAGATGNVSIPTTGSSQPAVTYGPKGPQLVRAGRAANLSGTGATDYQLRPLKIMGSEMVGDFSDLVIGAPTFAAAIDTAPHVTFTIADPDGKLLFADRNLWRGGTRVQYRDLSLRIDEITFDPGSHGTGQLTIACLDDIVYALMKLRGPRTASGISATQWIAQELRLAGIDPDKYFLGEAVPTQSVIARDVPDQQGSSGGGDAPSAWTTIVRLAKELGKRVFISGRRLVFGSSAFAMQWTSTGPLRLSWGNPPSPAEQFLTLPTAKRTSIGNRSDVLQVSCRVPLSSAPAFRPGVPVQVRNAPAIAGNNWITFMVTSIEHALNVDTDGADLTLTLPVDPPPEPPQSNSSAGANGGSTSAGGLGGGGGADGQVAKFVALALQQAGDRYGFGAEAAPSDPDPRAFDCSELVEWAAARAGISPRVPDGSSAQRAHCERHGTMISSLKARSTKGALLFMPGHVAISLGNGKTIEAMNVSQGVRQGSFSGRGWTGFAKIPGAKGYH